MIFAKCSDTVDTYHLVILGALEVVIVWEMDLQLPMQSVPITTNIVSLNPAQSGGTQYNIM